MGIFTRLAASIFAPVDASGNPRGPNLGEAQTWGTEIEAVLNGLTAGAPLLYTSRATLLADRAHAANTSAIVIGDPTAAYNGFYRKVGASGSGTWARVGGVPGYSFIIATNAGAGTPNAIVATTPTGLSSDAGVLVALPIVATNTGSPVTVAFDGGSVLTIKTNSGANVPTGALSSGMLVAGYKSGSNFQLISDIATSADRTAAEAAADRAEDASAAAAAFAKGIFATEAAVEANDTFGAKVIMTLAYDTNAVPGSSNIWYLQGSAPSSTLKRLQSNDGYWYLARQDVIHVPQFGIAGDDSTDELTNWRALAAHCVDDTVIYGAAHADSSDWIDRVSDQVAFTKNRIQFHLGKSGLRMTAAGKAVFYFSSSVEAPEFHGGRFYGRGGASGDFDGADVTWDGGAAIWCELCSGTLMVFGTEFYDHCEICINAEGVDTRIDRIYARGIGSAYISDGDHGSNIVVSANGQRSAVPAKAKVNHHVWTGWDCGDSSFVGYAAMTASIISHSHRYIAAIGQHPFYLDECDNAHFFGFTISFAAQIGIKHSLSNDGFTYFGTSWTPGDDYEVGDLATAGNHLYVCLVTDHGSTTSTGPEGGSTKWAISELMHVKGGHFHDLTFCNCDQGIGFIKNTAANAVDNYHEAVHIHDCHARDCFNGLYLEGIKNGHVHNNTIDLAGEVSIYFTDFGGLFADNECRSGVSGGFSGYCSFDTEFRDNFVWDCAQGTDDAGAGSNTIPILIADLNTATATRFHESSPILTFLNNRIMFDEVDGVGAQVLTQLGSVYRVRIEGTKTNSTTGNIKLEGTLLGQKDNQPKFFRAGDRAPLFVVGSHTEVLSVDGSSTLSTLANVVCTLIAAQQANSNNTLPHN